MTRRSFAREDRGHARVQLWLTSAALRLREALKPGDQVDDLFLCVTRRTREGVPEFWLLGISPGEDQVEQSVYAGGDEAQLVSALAALTGLFEDASPPETPGGAT
jgi:hypothetical protein